MTDVTTFCQEVSGSHIKTAHIDMKKSPARMIKSVYNQKKNQPDTVAIAATLNKTISTMRHVNVVSTKFFDESLTLMFHELTATKKEVVRQSFRSQINISIHALTRYVQRTNNQPIDMLHEIFEGHVQELLAQMYGSKQERMAPIPFVYAVSSGLLLGTIVNTGRKSSMITNRASRTSAAGEPTIDETGRLFDSGVQIFLRTFISNDQLYRDQKIIKEKLTFKRTSETDDIVFGDISSVANAYDALNTFIDQIGYNALVNKMDLVNRVFTGQLSDNEWEAIKQE